MTSADRRPEVAPAVLTAIGTAIRAREVLRFDYAGAVRRAEPHHLVVRGGRWYLLAWDLERADWRTFRVDRLTPRIPTGPRFAPRPIPDVAAFVEARFRGGTDGWPCRGEAVVARPAAEVAPFVGDGIVEELDGDRCRVVLGSWSWVGLAAAFSRFDADLSGVAPAALREAFGALARRWAHAAS